MELITGIVVTTIMLLIFWIYKCIAIINPDKIGVKVFLGKPEEQAVSSGWYWTWWPFEKIINFPKEIMAFKFKVESIVSRKGWAKGHDGEIEPANIDILATFYCQFNESKIADAVQFSPGDNAKKLGPFLTPFVADAVRSLASRIPWRLTNQERFRFSQWVKARMEGGTYADISGAGKRVSPYQFETEAKNFRILATFDENGKCNFGEFLGKNKSAIVKKLNISKENVQTIEKPSPFVRIGLKNFSLAIEDINFTDTGLTAAISAPEKARLEAKAMVLTSEAEKTKKINEGEGNAIARKAMLEAIKDSPEIEALKTLEEMAKGQSNTIFHNTPFDLLLSPLKKLFINEGDKQNE